MSSSVTHVSRKLGFKGVFCYQYMSFFDKNGDFCYFENCQQNGWFVLVQKSSNIVGPPPSFERSAYKVGPCLASGNLDFERVPTIPRLVKNMPKLCLNCIKIRFLPNTCFHSTILEFWNVLGRGCLHDQAPVKVLSAKRWTFLADSISHVWSQLTASGIKCILWLQWERTFGSLHLVFLGFVPFAFPLTDFAS